MDIKEKNYENMKDNNSNYFKPIFGLSVKDWKILYGGADSNRIALYGAGKYGKVALHNIKKYLPQLEIIFFIDDNNVRNDSDIEGLKVLSLHEAIKQEKNFNIIITNYYISSVLKKIEAEGFDLNKVFFWGQFLIEDVDYSYLVKNRDNLYSAYNSLGDNLSKIIFESMVSARINKNIDLLGRTCETKQYFPQDIFEWNDEEVFVDGGAYDGDTIEAFLECTGQKYKYIYAFEPDKSNWKRLLNRAYTRNIKIYNAGLYSETKNISFDSNRGGSSKVGETGADTVQVIKFDDLDLPEKNISFIKMDIEGSELSALQGMKETIKKNKPKLAICIYHKLEDLWELPLYIKSLVPEYKLYIRNYTSYLDEIVLYAVAS